MKKVLISFCLSIVMLIPALPASANGIQIKIDGVTVVSDINPEIKNNRTMVPLRSISESLGATVEWSKSKAVLTKDNMSVSLTLNSRIAEMDGAQVRLDAAPYVKNNRVLVPLRFIAETFDCDVNYDSRTVSVGTRPLFFEGTKIHALQQEYQMTMGGVVQEVHGHAYQAAIYDALMKYKGAGVEAPADYSWRGNMDIPGSYAKAVQYDFLDSQGNGVKRYEIYSLIGHIPGDESGRYPKMLLYEAAGNEWMIFDPSALTALDKIIESAQQHGFIKVISNNVV